MREQGDIDGSPGEVPGRGVVREEAPRGEVPWRVRMPRVRQYRLLEGAWTGTQVAVHEVLAPVLGHGRHDDGRDPSRAQEVVRGHMAHVRPEGRRERLRPAEADRLQLQDSRKGPCEDTLRHGQIGVPSTSLLLTLSRRTTSISGRRPMARAGAARSSSRCSPPWTGRLQGRDRAWSAVRRTAREARGASSGTTISAMRRGYVRMPGAA